MPDQKSEPRTHGLKKLIKRNQGRSLLDPCDNCKKRRYNPCTCQRKNK